MNNHRFFFAAFVAALFAVPAYAGISKPSSPTFTKGHAEIKYSGVRYGDDSKRKNNEQHHVYEMEYGLTDRFMLGIETESERISTEGNTLSSYNLTAKYKLTTQGDWWLNSAVKGEYAHAAHRGEPDAVEIKLLASYKTGATRLLGNVNFEQEMGDNHSNGVALKSRFQVKHQYSKYISPGFEWHAEYGELDTLGDGGSHEHYAGPIIFGDLFTLGEHDIQYTLGYYRGLSHTSADSAARLQFGYEFAF